MLVPPAGEEHSPEGFSNVVFVVNPHDAVMDDVYHKLLIFSFYPLSMKKQEMLHRKKIFSKKKIGHVTFTIFAYLLDGIKTNPI